MTGAPSRRVPRRWTALAVAVVALSACSGADDPSAGSPSASQAEDVTTSAARSDDVLDELLTSDEPGCSAAVGVDGEVVWAAARGLADVSSGRELTTATTLDIGSVSKQFTATSVLLIVQDGRLSLADPLSRWVLELPAWSHDVTVDHLVHHVSGIPDYTYLLLQAGRLPSDRTTQEEAVAAIAAEDDVSGTPGTRFAYSNSNYVLLAEVVAAASGQRLPEFARARIFEPLGLSMAIDPSGAFPDNSGTGSARPYDRPAAGAEWQLAGSRWQQVGDGSVQTTPSELVRWADVYRTGELGGQELLEAQLRTPESTSVGGTGYGAGIVVARDGALNHSGAWAGFGTTFTVSDDHRRAVAVSCNRFERGAPDRVGQEITDALALEWIR